MLCLISVLAFVSAQPTLPVQTTLPVPVNQTILMSSLDLPAQGNYSIGYLPPTIVNLNNSSACRRISMFKFPALGSGSVMAMTLNALPETIPETCDISISLFTFPGQLQVGTQYIGTFTNNVAYTSEESMTVDVSSSRWILVNSSEYYFTIQTFTWNTAGTRCNMRIPWGLVPSTGAGGTVGSVSPKYALVIQQGPPDLACGATPWTTPIALDGGYVHMRMTGFLNASPTATATPTTSPTATATPTATASPTATATASYYLTAVSLTGTSPATATPISSMYVLNDFTYSASASVTATVTATASANQTPIYNSASTSMTLTPSPSPTSNYLRTVNQNLDAQSIFSNQLKENSGIIGGVVSGLVATILACVMYTFYKKKQEFGLVRSPVSSVVVKNPMETFTMVQV